MAVIYPKSHVSRRWDGALQARLRRAPLDQFLHANGVSITAMTPLADDLVRAAVLIIQRGLIAHYCSGAPPVREPTDAAMAQVGCVVSQALSAAIAERDTWRAVALQTTALMLSARLGPTAAAVASASLVRLHEQERGCPSPAWAQEVSAGILDLLGERTENVFARIGHILHSSSEQAAIAPPFQSNAMGSGH